MQKKYRLIKSYPGSPRLGVIIEWIDKFSGCWVQRVSNGASVPNWISIPITNPQNHPEFWEEVSEDTYQVMAYTYNNKIYYYTENPRLIGSKGARHYQETGVDFPGVLDDRTLVNLNILPEIHSVKRVSDDKVFTIDDMTVSEGTDVGKIISFTKTAKEPHRILVTFERVNSMGTTIRESYFLDAKGSTFFVKEKKIPLFKTDDGVEIFEDDDYFWVHRGEHSVMSEKGCDRRVILGRKPYFSKKELAEEYLMMNAPCLSINDVATVYINANSRSDQKYNAQPNKLQRLVKQKLNL